MDEDDLRAMACADDLPLVCAVALAALAEQQQAAFHPVARLYGGAQPDSRVWTGVRPTHHK